MHYYIQIIINSYSLYCHLQVCLETSIIIQKMEQKKAQLQNYLATKVTTFIQPMLTEAAKAQPNNPLEFCIKWLQKNQQRKKKAQENSDSQGEDDTVDQLVIIKKRKQMIQQQGKKKSRMAISEEVFGQFNKKSVFAPKKIQKSQEAKLLILSLIRNCILFQNVDSKDEEGIIDAMSEQNCQANDTIINQGAAGDMLYIVQSGEYDCFKQINGEQKYLKTYKYGDSFGQLSLMYNAPRAATIICKQPGRLFLLDRFTFSQLVKNAASKKRQLFQNVLSKIEVFSELNSYEKEQFCDALKEQRYQQGEYVVQQGGAGDKFFIVIEGKLVAEKFERYSLDPKVVFHYKEGDYFGELALLHDVDRQANVKALTNVRLASIERDSFMRILGSLKSILKRNEAKYKKYNKEIELVC